MKDEWKKWSTRKKALHFLLWPEYMTATTLAKVIKVRLDSLSSLLKRMCDEGILERKADFGIRKGFGYRLNFERNSEWRKNHELGQ